MPLKRKPTPAPDGSTLAMRPQNASGSSADETARSTPAASEPPSEPQNDQTSTNTGDQFDLYTWAQQELSKVTSVPPNTADTKELDELAKKIANLRSIIDSTKPSRRLSSEEHESRGERIRRTNLDTLVKKSPPDIGGTTQQHFNRWIAAVKNRFKVNNADYNCERRTRWAIKGLAKEKTIAQLVHRRLGTKDKGPLLWDKFKTMIQDQIRNPTVRRFNNATAYYTAIIKENQRFDIFLAHMRSLEDRFSYTPFVNPEQQVDFWFSRLPTYLQAELFRQNFVERVRTAKDLFAEIRRVEQLLDTAKLAEDRIVGSGKSSRSKRGRSTGSTESGSGNRTQKGQHFKQTPGETTQKPDGSGNPPDASATHASQRTAGGHHKEH